MKESRRLEDVRDELGSSGEGRMPSAMTALIYASRTGREEEDHVSPQKEVHLPDITDELSSFQPAWRLGEGVSGTVYARHGNEQAVKVVSLRKYDNKGRELLRTEAETLLSLSHPNVVRCLGVGENDLERTYVFVTELCCGDLRREMDRRRRDRASYSDQEVWMTIRDVAAALAYLHEKRLVHRDLKPGNVLLAPDGRCVLGDFGLTRALDDTSRMSTAVGTRPYMAPEIHRNEEYDKSVDVWALGVVGYELCTYSLPFGNIAAILEETPAPRLEDRPPGLADLVSRMLSKDPRDRPTARDVLEEALRY